MRESGFCERIKQARLDAHFALIHAAHAINTSVSYITGIEQGQFCPSVERVVELAKLYGVGLDWLCGMEVNPDA